MQPYMPGLGPIGQDMPEHDLFTGHAPQIERSQGRIFLTVSETSRVGIATSIERLIDYLDALDLEMSGDVELEDTGDDEPSLGWTANGQLGENAVYANRFGDLEEECEDEGAQDDREPTMGWQNHGSQAFLHATYNDECEEENEHGGNIQDVPHDAVDEGNDEPFFGWSETCGQGPKIGIDATPNDIDPDP